ncbi:MAG: hypothetical protein ABSH09_17860 [Bryobacteraceae bacterium]|jgi:hypothetical protein
MKFRFGAGALFALSSIAAQDVHSSYAGQTWVGLLVSSSCAAPAESKSAMKQSDLTVSDRVTTPAVDAAGTRGESKVNETSEAERSTRKDVPLTGDVSAHNSTADAGWRQAKRQAATLGAGCRIGDDTNQFALLLPDGKTIRFDNLANAGIAKQIASQNSPTKTTIYRVQVVGKLENGMIALDNIQL